MKRILLLLVLLLTMTVGSMAQPSPGSIEDLHERMHALFHTNKKQKFMDAAEELKAKCKKEGNEEVFYAAWANEVVYLAQNDDPEVAIAEAKKMKHYALEQKSQFGAYTAINAMASMYYHMKDFEQAEEMFLESIDYLHQYFPGQSAAAAYIELVKIAKQRADYPLLEKYAKLALEEPNCEPQHRLRALSHLCELASERNDVEQFDVYYAERKEVLKLTPPSSMAADVELSRLIMHNEFDKARHAAEKLSSPAREYRLGRIAHREGKDSLAYVLMKRSKLASDSLNKAVHADMLDDYIDQLDIERRENETIQQKNLELAERVNLVLWILAIVIIAAMSYTMWHRYRIIQHLKEKNQQLQVAKDKEHEARIAEHEAKEKEHQARMAEHEALEKEHKALQGEHEARQEAERALQVKRGFLNNVSHEMRTPLNAISGFTQLLTDSEVELDEDARMDIKYRIMDSTEVLTGIVDNMITLSFYDSKSSIEREDTVRPMQLVRELADTFRPKAHEGVVVTSGGNLPDDCAITTNLQALQKALQTLLDNSVNYTESGSIDISVSQTGDQTVFTISDTGLGVPEEKRQHLFELFSETGGAVKTTGMGLNICRSIAHLLGGSIQYDQTHSPGSRFILSVES